MNTDIRDRWIAALRSGDYKQGKGNLHATGGAFCCLGVLCALYSDDCDEPWAHSRPSTSLSFPSFGLHDEYTLLPQQVMDWAELDDPDPVVGRAGLTVLNDDQGASFDEIAALIEKNL